MRLMRHIIFLASQGAVLLTANSKPETANC